MKPLLIWQNGIFPETEREIAEEFFEVEIFNLTNPLKTVRSFLIRGALSLTSMLGIDISRYDCRNWVPHLYPYMASKDFAWQCAGKLAELKEYDFPIFIRPDSGKKIFSGQVFSFEKWQEEFNFLKQANAEKVLCFSANPERIEREWRCLFVGEKLMGITDYMENGEIQDDLGQREITEELKNLALEIRSNPFFFPEECVTIDIGRMNDKSYKLIEINNLETSGWYAADPYIIYKELATIL